MHKKLRKSLAFLLVSTTIIMIAIIPPYINLKRESSVQDKKVAAFYYGWFSNTTDFSSSSSVVIKDDTNWRHWGSNSYQPPYNACSTFTPQIGWYDCADPATIEKQLRQAEWAGIDSFVVSYWGQNSIENQNFKNMIRVAKSINSNLTFTFYFEIFMGGLDKKNESEAVALMVDEFSYIYNLFNSSEYKDYIWFEEGKPVLFSYVVQAISASVWQETKKSLESDLMTFFLVGDRPGKNEDYNQVFDATHQYDVYAPTKANKYLTNFFNLKLSAQKYNQIFIAGVAPGYDDHKVRDGNPPLSREMGETYHSSWENAISLNPDWITITSWNEWHEGSEIEPSIENKDLALNQTKLYISEFKSGEYTLLESIDFYQSLMLYCIISVITAWIIFEIYFLLNRMNPKGNKQKSKNSFKKVFSGLFILIEWIALGYLLNAEIILGKVFEITGTFWIFALPVFLLIHLFIDKMLYSNKR
jgi:glycoprotein endo-alpha-1,2-mannosidase